jgi:hypothetical protein
MLKEVFVIGSGLLYYHYASRKAAADTNQAILSSGLLGALKEFSETTRENAIEQFSMENEFFVFTSCCGTDKMLVGVFDRNVSQQLARDALSKIHALIAKTSIPHENVPDYNSPDRRLLDKSISALASQFFGLEGQAPQTKDLLSKRTDIPLAFIVHSQKRKVISHFARPEPLFKDEHVQEFLLLQSTLIGALKQLELPEQYAYFTIRSREYSIGSCWSGQILSIASGTPQAPTAKVLDAALNLCHYQSVNSLVPTSEQRMMVSKATLLGDGRLRHEEGKPYASGSEIFLLTLVKALDRFCKFVNRRAFDELELVTSGENTMRLSIRRAGSAGDCTVELSRRS